MQDHDQSVTAQFDPLAQAYLASSVHAQGPDLAWVRAWLAASDRASTNALDVGCGAGHLGFALGSHFAAVTLADPSPSMLATALTESTRRGLEGVRTQACKAEQLPFDDRSFDLVATRFSAHHWGDVPAALRQMRRVVEPTGQLLLIDLLGDELPLVDTHLQALELLRDPSHVRDYSATQWRAMIRESGFTVTASERWPLRMEFATWVGRMRTPQAAIDALRVVMAQAPREVHDGLRVEPDGSFTAMVGLFVADAS
ncbi:MAG TPA: methyltransferase domain-containing protein [Steroidobacteraceae bacterium]|jgi:ubiquinone/menaquinone biosynthesis C-methylase UbiE|nr:methyltransferase domain-containing protein [Steroidobacteraceae bacterium]